MDEVMPPSGSRARLSFAQIVNMNVGFFGIQYSFGLQQSNMSPIYKYLGADEATLPLLWLAGPMTGLLVQPIVGALSDRTATRWGRRTPFFLVGAILCSASLVAMPFSPALWMAASLLWILDASNNVTMEPYRAFVADRLDRSQLSLGYLTQSAFTGLAQTLAYLTPTLMVVIGMNKDAVNASGIPLVTVAAFLVGAVCSIASIAWTVATTKEAELTPPELEALRAQSRRPGALAREIVEAMRTMPPAMKQLAVMQLFQWYAMFCYWQYIVLSLAQTYFGTADAATEGFRDAGLVNGRIGAFYNFVAFAAAFLLMPLARRFGARRVHCACLVAAGAGMLAIPEVGSTHLLYLPMIGVGLGWASMMGNPYIMLAGCIPPRRAGVYMGLFNLFIVIPMMIEIFTLPLLYGPVLGNDPVNVIRLAGVLLGCAAIATLFVRVDTGDARPGNFLPASIDMKKR